MKKNNFTIDKAVLDDAICLTSVAAKRGKHRVNNVSRVCSRFVIF